MSAKRIACRYGKNGYFGVCGCLECMPPTEKVTAPPVVLAGSPDALLALAAGVPFKIEGTHLVLAPFAVTKEEPRRVIYYGR